MVLKEFFHEFTIAISAFKSALPLEIIFMHNKLIFMDYSCGLYISDTIYYNIIRERMFNTFSYMLCFLCDIIIAMYFPLQLDRKYSLLVFSGHCIIATRLEHCLNRIFIRNFCVFHYIHR